jgi:hypothetical protein
MPQWLSLVIFYTTVIVVFLSIITLVVACTTTHPAAEQRQTEHLPTGKTPATLHQSLDEWEAQYRQRYGMKSPYRINEPGEEGSGSGR